MASEIVVVGSIFMDLICYADRLPKPAETLAGTGFHTGYGGKGANQCVATQRLGAKTAFIGKVGNDGNGKQYYDNLKAEGVNVEGIKIEENVPTGVASIMVGNVDGQNIIVTVAGANALITPSFVQETAEKPIANAKVLLCQMEIPMESSRTALELAKKHGITSIFNVAPATSDIPIEMCELADILCLNEPEAEVVCGYPEIKTELQAKLAIEKLVRDSKCKNIIITLGPAGALLWDAKEKAYYFEAAPKHPAVDTTGAGDCFVGTFAYCLANGDSLRIALKKSVVNASRSVLKKGTQSSFPYQIMA